MQPFDRRQLRRQRERAAAGFDRHDFLAAEVADRLLDRLADTARHFALALDLGCHTGVLARRLAAQPAAERRIGTLLQCDLSPGMAARAARSGAPAFAADDEALPVAAGALDLVVSGLSLQAVNDLPGALVQLRRALRPDGLLLAAMLGGATLAELRGCLIAAEAELCGGAGPRVAPFADIRQAGGLLQRAGFALPVVDSDTIPATYPDALTLMRDLRGMALGNALAARRRGFTPAAVLARAAALYAERHGTGDGRIVATFEVVFLHGWAPSAAQPQPLRPGSARTRLADALGAAERSAGEKAGPAR
ncbi:MAG: methyltransferase domain-containing protein [Alphaproteobacteria bacterium]